MKFVKIQKQLVDKYSGDEQIMLKEDRPYVLIVKLRFRGKNQAFAIPFRSNIHPSTPKKDYFAFPPRPTTKPKHHHGIHYTKMFPVENKYFEYFRADSEYYKTLLKIIDKNEKQIVEECQAYLDRYEKGNIPMFATNLDYLLTQLHT